MASQADNPETSGHPRILRLKEVMHRTGDSRSSIYRLDKKGILRRAKHLAGSHTAGWLEDSVDAYIESRRPDAIPGRFDTGLAKASKVHTLIRPQAHADVVRADALAGPASAKIAKSGRISGDLQATTMEIMGNRVYLHAPTGKLFLEIGKSPASSQGINIVGTQEGMEAESGNDGSGPAKRKRRAAG